MKKQSMELEPIIMNLTSLSQRSVTLQKRYVQYCAKVMQTIINEYRTLFSRFLADISAINRTDWRTLKRYISEISVQSLHYLAEISV